MRKVFMVVCLSILFGSAQSFAALAIRDLDGNLSNGHEGVYDNVLDITWLADANYANTSRYDNNGKLTGIGSDAFIQHLNSESYLGVNDWRQPTASGLCWGYNCGNAPADTDDELGYHHYQNFGASAGGTMISGTNSTNLQLFSNIDNWAYWTGTEFESPTLFLYIFDISNGYTRSGPAYNSNFDYYVWPVHDGDIGASFVPLPAAAWLLTSALIGLVAVKRNKA